MAVAKRNRRFECYLGLNNILLGTGDETGTRIKRGMTSDSNFEIESYMCSRREYTNRKDGL
jgi:hypothetical protein